MNDFIQLHMWLPGTQPEHNPASLIVNTPEALEFVLQALYRDQQTNEGILFHVVAKQGDSVAGSGQYSIGERLTVLHEENLRMPQWWNAANSLTT